MLSLCRLGEFARDTAREVGRETFRDGGRDAGSIVLPPLSTCYHDKAALFADRRASTKSAAEVAWDILRLIDDTSSRT